MKILFCLLAIFTSAELSACSCMPRTFGQNFESAEFVAIAKLLEIGEPILKQNNTTLLPFRFEVKTQYKGKAQEFITVLSPSERSACGISHSLNEDFRLYCGKNIPNLKTPHSVDLQNVYFTNSCSGTHRILHKEHDSRIREKDFLDSTQQNNRHYLAIAGLLMIAVFVLLWFIMKNRN